MHRGGFSLFGAKSRRAGSATRPLAATKIGELTPHPSAQGRYPLPTGEGREYPPFSLGEKVAEERGRMRGLVIQMLAKKTSINDLALQSKDGFRFQVPAKPRHLTPLPCVTLHKL
jgi:hypothetical protein